MSAPAPRPVARRGRLLLALPPLVALAEIVVAVALYRRIGWWVLVVIAAVSAIGVLLMGSVWRRARRDLRQLRRTGRAPDRPVSDAAVRLAGSALIALPGLVTGVLGLVLLLPFSRSLARRLAAVVLTRRVGRVLGVTVHPGAGRGFGGPVVTGTTAQPGRPAGPGGAEPPGQEPQRRVIEGRVVGEDDETPR